MILSKEIKERESKVLDNMQSIGMNTFICANPSIGRGYGNLFKKLTERLKEEKYIPSYSGLKADSIFTVIPDSYSYKPQYYLILELYNNRTVESKNYSSVNNGDNNASIPEKMLSIVLDSIEEYISDRKKEIKINSKLPEISELMPKFLEMAKKHIKEYEHYEVEIRHGRLNRETNTDPYDCLVVTYNNPKCQLIDKSYQYVGLITFSRSQYGDYGMCISTPLAGDRPISVEKLDDYDIWIKEAMRYLCN